MKPKTESWEEKIDRVLTQLDINLEIQLVKDLKNLVRHEKQLSYQEVVEKIEKLMFNEDGYAKLMPWELRHQLSILKGDKK